LWCGMRDMSHDTFYVEFIGMAWHFLSSTILCDCQPTAPA
jgi:hypothetical protein